MTGRPANPAGGVRPASRHWLPDRKKIPVTPGRRQAPASSGAPAEPNATAVSPVSPQDRPAGLAARALVLTSGLQPAPLEPDSCTPVRVSASSLPSGPAASADAAAARPDGSRPGDQCWPSSRLLASGENVRSWLGTNPATRPGAVPAPSPEPAAPEPLPLLPGPVVLPGPEPLPLPLPLLPGLLL